MKIIVFEVSVATSVFIALCVDMNLEKLRWPVHIPFTYSKRSAIGTQSGGTIVVDVDTRKHVVYAVTLSNTVSETKQRFYLLPFT